MVADDLHGVFLFYIRTDPKVCADAKENDILLL